MDVLGFGAGLMGVLVAWGWIRRRSRSNGALTFLERAGLRGVQGDVARLLEKIAKKAFPDRPSHLLHARQAFEHAVQNYVLCGDEVFGFEALLDLAIAKERLGLRNVSERPAPFQRCTLRRRHRSELEPAIIVASGNHLRIVLPQRSAEDSPIVPEEKCFLRFNTPRSMAEIPMMIHAVEAFDGGCVLALRRVAHDEPIGRKEGRAPVFVDAWVAFPGEEDHGEFGTVFNLTESGLLFETERRYPETAHLQIRLNLGKHGVFAVEGSVRWSCPNVDERWRHGFSFDATNASPLAPLRAYLNDVAPRVSRAPSPLQVPSP